MVRPPKHILLLAPHLEPIDGIQRCQLDVAGALTTSGDSVSLLYEHGGANLELWEGLTDGRLVRTDLQLDPKRLAQSARTLRSVVRSRGIPADLIYCHRLDHLRIASVMSVVRKRPLVAHLHNLPPPGYHWGAKAHPEGYAVARVVMPSEFMLGRWQNAGVPADKLKHVPHGIDVDRFRPATADERAQAKADLGLPLDAVVVAFTGRFEKAKGVSVLARAFAAVAPDYPDALLYMSGSANLSVSADQTIALEDELGEVLHGCQWVRRESRPDVEAIYRAADIVVYPSVWDEPSGLVVAEGMASGLPVISSSVGGIPEQYPDMLSAACLVAPDDPPALASAIARLLADEDLRQDYGRIGRAHIVATRSIESQAPKIFEGVDGWAGARREAS